MTRVGGARVLVLDYGMSNLHSACKALEFVGAEVTVTESVVPLGGIDAVVLPGVGHFGEAARRIRTQGLDTLVRDAVAAERPLLGICLGMQLLFDSSEEAPGAAGLSIIPGVVRRLETRAKLPNIGWRAVEWSGVSDIAQAQATRDGVADAYYFVHTYGCEPLDPAAVVGTAEHGVTFCAAVNRGSVDGVQFHPEKSSRAGIALLGRWLARVRERGAVPS
ncbi:MAG: imidazole glycerol phosphate synthase subunit HisH [Actinobacteria bacterium]|nr:imidazole glycerol phosphate synthase subunit HisH [Actinomycetota bacterium]